LLQLTGPAENGPCQPGAALPMFVELLTL
jgi:hypothetical protein